MVVTGDPETWRVILGVFTDEQFHYFELDRVRIFMSTSFRYCVTEIWRTLCLQSVLINSIVLTIISKLLRFSPSLVFHLLCFRYPTIATRAPRCKYFSAISAFLLKQVHFIQLVFSRPDLNASENNVTGSPWGPTLVCIQKRRHRAGNFWSEPFYIQCNLSSFVLAHFLCCILIFLDWHDFLRHMQ